MTLEHKAQLIGDICSAALTGLMVLAAELLGDTEIVFPEITALTVGALCAPKLAWRTSRLRCVVFIALCAALGLCASMFLPLPLFAKVILMFAVCQILFVFSGTSFAPMISAAVLPVLMGCESIAYPISAVTMAALVMLANLLLTKAGLRSEEKFVPLESPTRRELLDVLLRVALAAVLIFAAITAGWKFCIAPPLLVAFTEFSKRECPARKKPVRAVAVIVLCAAWGAAARGVLCAWLGLPLFAAAIIACAAAILTVRKAGMFLPPAGALAILPMIIPLECLTTYPLQIAAGAAVLMALALAVFREKPLPNPNTKGN